MGPESDNNGGAIYVWIVSGHDRHISNLNVQVSGSLFEQNSVGNVSYGQTGVYVYYL